ncbi:hypothetical protein IMZ48_01500 [Candidatus Bathyarchaeota archaeon]|nr:hypothetical protein [Candidatus Bathyarchaeota archaeon]
MSNDTNREMEQLQDQPSTPLSHEGTPLWVPSSPSSDQLSALDSPEGTPTWVPSSPCSKSPQYDVPSSTAVSNAPPLATNLIDLPTELLEIIFDNFEDSLAISFHARRLRNMAPRCHNPNQLALQNSRLACKALRVIASPYLLPVITIHLDQFSLDKLDSLSRNPLIAKGVHGLEVNIAYRAQKLATDMKSFEESKFQGLNNIRQEFFKRIENPNISRFSDV